jgi:hypothetical protein
MAPLNNTLHLVAANEEAEAGSPTNTHMYIGWILFVVFVLIVLLIAGLVAISKPWIIDYYAQVRHGVRRGKKPAANSAASTYSHTPIPPITTSSPPHWLFTLISTCRNQADKQDRRRAEQDRQRKAREEAFADIHLHDIREWGARKKPALQSRNLPEPSVMEKVGLPLPVLHLGKHQQGEQRKAFLYSKNYAGFKQWLKDDGAKKAGRTLDGGEEV